MPVPPDAIELSVAASEAMVIAEMILDDPHSSKLAALHVKEASKFFYSDVIQDVGLSLDSAVSSQYQWQWQMCLLCNEYLCKT